MTDSLATPKTAFLFAIGLPLMHAAQPALADDEKTNAEATVVSVLSEQITADTLTPLGMCSTDGGELRMALGWTGPTPKAIEWRTFPQPNPPNRRDPTWMLTLDKDDKVCRSWADPRLIPQGFATNDAGDFLIFGELRSGSPRPEVRLFDKDGGEKWSVNLNEYITGLARNETFEVAGAALHSVGENEFAYLAVNFINRNASPVIVVLKAQDGTQVRQIPTTKTSATHGIVWDGMTKIRQGDQSRVVVYGAFLEASNKIVDGRRAVTQYSWFGLVGDNHTLKESGSRFANYWPPQQTSDSRIELTNNARQLARLTRVAIDIDNYGDLDVLGLSSELDELLLRKLSIEQFKDIQGGSRSFPPLPFKVQTIAKDKNNYYALGVVANATPSAPDPYATTDKDDVSDSSFLVQVMPRENPSIPTRVTVNVKGLGFPVTAVTAAEHRNNLLYAIVQGPAAQTALVKVSVR